MPPLPAPVPVPPKPLTEAQLAEKARMQILNILTGVAFSQNASPPTAQDIWCLVQAYSALRLATAATGANG